MREKELTFIMPTYNSAEYIERTLQSLEASIADHNDKVEVLFVDDGSTDRTVDILKEKVKQQSIYKLIQNKHGGVSKARNCGIKEAVGKYVTFIDSDDIYASNFVEKFLKQITYLPDILWVDMQRLPADKNLVISKDEQRLELMKMVLGMTTPSIQEGIASKFYRREFLLDNQIFFNEDVVISEDTLFILQALDKVKEIYLSSYNFYKILDEHSLSRFNEKTLVGELAYEQQVDKLLAKYLSVRAGFEIISRIKLNGICTLVRRYYGAKIIRGEVSISNATSQLKRIINKYNYAPYLKCKAGVNSLPKRYRLFYYFIKVKSYQSMIRFNVYLDKLKKLDWK
ncbi:glycosyltransferase family 2 protein [Ligilactobacillus apodemi]|uniref:Glycosyltransferase involved in cell wall biogenesis n=1 Tax=Ligilactobacillus apodemi DSM 16634 = JCM 16172 TaxID=1423724 RepID=A0A0R1U284_9LACO|nr:glycosyltransferase family A protein [Ligilactobacillus apodemi]KRL87449.1 glycosyltransferase involved in cell wall biogenesis [Ligilactobacillus apodemi DSM 16634 = JCM 16172]